MSDKKYFEKSVTQGLRMVFLVTLTSFALIACGGGSGNSSEQTTTPSQPITPENTAPTANAGSDQTVNVDSQVNLDASVSSDSDGDNIIYSWVFTSFPDGSTASLSNSTSSSPTFLADKEGSYIVSLTVNDGTEDSIADAVLITATKIVTNTAPIANAGVNQSVSTGVQVNLDGSDSSDDEGDSLTYQWSLDSIPNGSSTSLSSITNSQPSFTADIDGDYIISLVVNDDSQSSFSDSIIITATTNTEATLLNYSIVDTAQLACYNSSTGQETTCSNVGYDADYAGNQPNYTLSQDGLIVTDNVTGLVWLQSTDTNGDNIVDVDDKLLQSEAVSYCQNLTKGDRSDWRLPSIKESFSLIMFTGEDPSGYQGSDTSSLIAFLNDIFDWGFGDLNAGERIIDGQYASSTLYLSTTMNNDATMFGVNFIDGRIKGYPSDNKVYYARCVAGNSDYGVNDFSDNLDQTVSDNATGLMWQQNDAESTNWDDAIAQCEAATTANYSDWRLPNVKELQSIVDYERSPDTHNSAAIDPVFNATSIVNEAGNTDWGAYWASTTHANSNGYGDSGSYVTFGRALGYMNGSVIDVHGAGAQRSNNKVSVANEEGASSATGATGTFYYKGPQGDILRDNNKIRCVR